MEQKSTGAKPEKIVKVTIWAGGFQFDDGEFRGIDAPENIKTADELLAGGFKVPPKEIVDKYPDFQVKMKVEGDMKQQYVPKADPNDTRPVKEVKVTSWAGGFQFEDGEYRSIDAPENQTTVSELLRSGFMVAPKEIRDKYPDFNIKLVHIDNRTKQYEKPSYTAYSGSGIGLGGTAGIGGAVNTNSSDGKPVVDESQPFTTIQIIFHNRQKASLKVNLTHKVEHIYNFVASAAPVDGEYQLVKGFPPKPLNDPSLTIEQAGLKNSSLTQKII